MRVHDSIYRYPAFWTQTTLSHLRVYEHEGSTVAIVGALTDNPSTSVTNRIEAIVEQLCDEYGETVIVIEHHPATEELRTEATFDTVLDRNDSWVPDWRRLSPDDVEMLVGEPVEVWAEVDYTTSKLIAGGKTAP